jgi:SPP1 gp7 family putative phage head morphogenesis protein
MTTIDDALRKMRAAALRAERASQRAILAAWSATLANLRPYITAAIAQAAVTQASLPPGATFAVAALPTVRALVSAMQMEMRTFALVASTAVVAGQSAAVASAPALAAEAILAALGSAPSGAVVPNIVASALFVPNESAAQIAATIARLAPGMGDAGARAIADGVLRGAGPREIARDVRRVTSIAPTRALLVSRTSINQGFRNASLSSYRQNAGVVTGWYWICSASRRTCGPCFARHGTFHTLDESFASHPACRCAAIPATRSWAELGFPGVPDTRPEIRGGEEVFGALGEADQRFVLGPGKFKLWQDGAIELADLVSETFNPVYGRGIRETTLRELKAG